MTAAISAVLPPGEAQASSTRCPGTGAGEPRDQLRRLVLHDEVTSRGQAGLRTGLPDDHAESAPGA